MHQWPSKLLQGSAPGSSPNPATNYYCAAARTQNGVRFLHCLISRYPSGHSRRCWRSHRALARWTGRQSHPYSGPKGDYATTRYDRGSCPQAVAKAESLAPNSQTFHRTYCHKRVCIVHLCCVARLHAVSTGIGAWHPSLSQYILVVVRRTRTGEDACTETCTETRARSLIMILIALIALYPVGCCQMHSVGFALPTLSCSVRRMAHPGPGQIRKHQHET